MWRKKFPLWRAACWMKFDLRRHTDKWHIRVDPYFFIAASDRKELRAPSYGDCIYSRFFHGTFLFGVDLREMNYERRLKAAAKLILLHDSGSDNSPESCPDFGVTATLKPYQVEGVLWLIRRYHLGVNVILGYTPISFLGTIDVEWADEPQFSIVQFETSFVYTIYLFFF